MRDRPTEVRRQLYGRRKGHRLRPGRRRLLERRLPELTLTLPETAPLDLERVFPGRARFWLEIGFGAGEHLAAQAARHADVGIIGCEPFIEGIAKLVSAIDEQALGNVRLFVDDARMLLPVLPDASLERIFVLFPDPWPKARHHKRRLVNHATAREFARLLAPGGELRLATDDMGYARWMLQALLACPDLEWQAKGPRDWRRRPADWPPTRYEEKAIAAGRRPVYLRFRRHSATRGQP